MDDTDEGVCVDEIGADDVPSIGVVDVYDGVDEVTELLVRLAVSSSSLDDMKSTDAFTDDPIVKETVLVVTLSVLFALQDAVVGSGGGVLVISVVNSEAVPGVMAPPVFCIVVA